jgi:hypothetical protein
MEHYPLRGCCYAVMAFIQSRELRQHCIVCICHCASSISDEEKKAEVANLELGGLPNDGRLAVMQSTLMWDGGLSSVLLSVSCVV